MCGAISKECITMSKGFITREAGAVLNKSNTTAIKAAMTLMTSVLKAAGIDFGNVDDTTDEAATDPPAKKPAAAKKTTAVKTPATAKEARVTPVMEAAGFSWSDLAGLLQNALNDTQEAVADQAGDA